MTTSDARKRIRENAAQAATTPAPVAVPEGGWQPSDLIVVSGGSNAQPWRREARDWFNELGVEASDCDVDNWIAQDCVVYVHAPREDAPRPEPVTAPLPSEAAEAAWGEFRDGPDYQATDRYDVRSVFEAGYAAADQCARDEGTVREEIAREIQKADRKRLDRIIDRAPVEGTRHLVDIVLTQAAHIARGGTR